MKVPSALMVAVTNWTACGKPEVGDYRGHPQTLGWHIVPSSIVPVDSTALVNPSFSRPLISYV